MDSFKELEETIKKIKSEKERAKIVRQYEKENGYEDGELDYLVFDET